LLSTAPSCRQGRFQSSLGAIVVSPKKLTPGLPPPPPCGRALPAVTPRMSMLLRANCAKRRGPGFRVRFSLSKEIRPTLPPSRRAGAVNRDPPRRQGGFCLLVILPHEARRIRRMRGWPTSWVSWLWPRWSVCPSLPLMAHWPPLLLPPVLVPSITLGDKIWMIAMIPPLPLRAVLGGRRRVWCWGEVVLPSPPVTPRIRRPITR